MTKEEIIDFEQLYDSATKCRRSVTWKPSTKSYILNQFENTLRMERKLKNGTWKNGKPKEIKILYPKKRDGLSIQFRDRVYQRSINDNELYPTMTKSFILDNCACQKGKGPDFARERIKRKLHNYVMKHGLEGWILQIDIHGYYPSMDHGKVNEMFREKLTPEVAEMVTNVLDQQYSGDVGYNPGSQMVQIAGISFLDKLDHKCKEQLHMENYERYMDDTWDVDTSKDFLESCLENIEEELKTYGFQINEKKTHITPLRDGFLFLGFYWKVTETGKVILTLDPQNVKHERRKLRRMVNKSKRGELPRKKVDECYEAWKAHASKGNSYKLIKRMDSYYNSLWG